MKTNLYRLVYCSRNHITGTEAEVSAEIESILAKSRFNNSRNQLTGALLYNAGDFAQILEGPLEAIERTFEVIQRDPRHSEVTVVQSGRVDHRDFPEWSMAFAGNDDTESVPVMTAAFDAVFANTVGAGEQMLSLLKGLLMRDDHIDLIPSMSFS